MAFRFQKASCVVVGTFNMYILHPQWLAKHSIIEKGAEVLIQTNFAQPGFRFRLPKNNTLWLVAPNRIAVESEHPEIDCGAPIARVLRALPETPLFAIGNNTHYRGDAAELERLSAAIREFPRVESPRDSDVVVQRTFHVGVKREEHRVANLQLALTEEGLELACNMHNELGSREDANEAAIRAANQFFDDRLASKSLAQHFFGTSIDHGTDHN